jgi:enediyne biosynthesis protein E4
VDLNNSGALDLVVNNLNAPASIYRNRSRELEGTRTRHFLRVMLEGDSGNTNGIGAIVRVTHGDRQQVLEMMPTRGFQSSVDPRLHFGLGDVATIDSLIVIWPDRRYQVLTNVRADQAITLRQTSARGRYAFVHRSRPVFEDVTAAIGIPYRHVENEFVDFYREPLMPHMVSREGPAIAVADVNGDGLEDLFLGGAKWQAGALYLQRRDGSFSQNDQPALRADSSSEDVDAAFLDANGDGHNDLYVVSGGNEYSQHEEPLQDRLYINDGTGRFRRDTLALPRMSESGACVAPGDFNGDGRIDLFVGRRTVARQYGVAPRSMLLANDGNGRFTDVTADLAPSLASAGMVTSAAWVDYDGDQRLDLVVAGEWMPVRVFRQENGRFADRTSAAGFDGTHGWWRSVSVADVNADHRPDLILGNLGSNSFIRVSSSQPARLYVADFNRTGSTQALMSFYRNGESYLLGGRDELLTQFPRLEGRYGSYASFGAGRIEDIVPAADRERATVLETRDLASAIAINAGGGRFRLRPLPAAAQLAPISASLARDFDGDGRIDVLVAGNLYGVSQIEGGYDAGYGLLMRGDGSGGLAPMDLAENNVIATGEVRRMRILRSARWGDLLVMARNGETLQILRPTHPSVRSTPAATSASGAPE